MSGRVPLRRPMQPPKYSVTRCGGGQTPQGVSYPGGLDLTTPSLSLQPGALRACLNYECSQSGGYGRINGYERFDGHASPSNAAFVVVAIQNYSSVPPVGAIVTQPNTGATGTIVAVNQNPNYLVLTAINGVFDTSSQVFSNTGELIVTAANPQTITAANPLTISAVLVGNATVGTFAISAQQSAQLTAAAADVYRAAIGPVPGSGAVLGVVGMIFNGQNMVYAFRANSAGTQVLLYQATPNGWQNIPFFNTVNFTLGTNIGGGSDYQPPDNSTLTQGGVTATIQRVMWQSGTFNGSSAVGKLVVTNPIGGNFSAGAATLSDGTTVQLSSGQMPIVLQPGGRYQFVKANFSGQLVTRRIYGCDGVNQCFEFDGTTYAPISTGLTVDAPSNIAFHKNYLFISYQSSLFYCGVGTPFMWDSIDGGGEIATGDTVTGFLTLPGSQTTATLAVFLRSNSAFLYGTDPTTFNYVTFNTGIGALPYSAQNLFDTFAFDDIGIFTLRTTLNWGNFLPSTLTKNILPFIIQERSKLVASSILREKSQYRVFFSDGYGIYLTMANQSYLGLGVVQFPNPVYCIDEGEDEARTEVSYFGSSDGLGYVYQLDVGTSFDGAELPAYITLAWDAIKSPRILKQFRAGSIEIQSDTFAEVSFGYQLGYGSLLVAQPGNTNYQSNFAAAPNWDSFSWDGFVWDGQTLSPTDVDMTGTAENAQVTISSATNYIGAYNINSIIYHYSMRRGIRV